MKRQTENLLIALIIGLTLIVTGIGLRNEVKTAANNLKSAQDKVVKIGLIVPLSGEAKAFGISTENAFNLALEQAGHQAGDIKIEAVTADDKNDAEAAQKKAARLISRDKVQCIVGSVNSGPSIAISETADQAGVVQISGTASDPLLTAAGGRRKPYIFRTCFDDSTQEEEEHCLR
jgi:branched-chain amino acid transport system substrate-binding protein